MINICPDKAGFLGAPNVSRNFTLDSLNHLLDVVFQVRKPTSLRYEQAKGLDRFSLEHEIEGLARNLIKRVQAVIIIRHILTFKNRQLLATSRYDVLHHKVGKNLSEEDFLIGIPTIKALLPGSRSSYNLAHGCAFIALLNEELGRGRHQVSIKLH